MNNSYRHLSQRTPRSRPGRSLAVWLLVGLFVTLLVMVGQSGLLSIDWLQQRHSALVNYFATYPGPSYAAFALSLILLVSFSIPGVLIYMLFAGSAFKLWVAVPLVVLCRTAGAISAFLLGRYLARGWVERRFAATVRRIDRGVDKEGWLYLAMLRLAPILPDSVINPGMGLTSIRLWTFAWVSAIGMIPYVLLYAAAGRQLASLRSKDDLIDPQWLVLFAALAALLFVGKRLVDRHALRDLNGRG